MTRPEHRRIRPADVGRFARAVVARRLLIVAAFAAVGHVLVLTGAVPPAIPEQAEAWIVSGLDALALIVGIFYAQAATTPADPKLAPMSTNGLPLVESHFDEGGHVAPLPAPGARHADPAARADLRQRLDDVPGAERRPSGREIDEALRRQRRQQGRGLDAL